MGRSNKGLNFEPLKFLKHRMFHQSLLTMMHLHWMHWKMRSDIWIPVQRSTILMPEAFCSPVCLICPWLPAMFLGSFCIHVVLGCLRSASCLAFLKGLLYTYCSITLAFWAIMRKSKLHTSHVIFDIYHSGKFACGYVGLDRDTVRCCQIVMTGGTKNGFQWLSHKPVRPNRSLTNLRISHPQNDWQSTVPSPGT